MLQFRQPHCLITAQGGGQGFLDHVSDGVGPQGVYRQEWLLGDAEDMAENLSNTDTTASAPTLNNATSQWVCNGNYLKTHEYAAIEPDTSESKFYYPDVGVILTLDDNDPSFREELVQFTPGS